MKNLINEFSTQLASAATELKKQFNVKECLNQFSAKEFKNAFFPIKHQERSIKISSTFDSRNGIKTVYNEKR